MLPRSDAKIVIQGSMFMWLLCEYMKVPIYHDYIYSLTILSKSRFMLRLKVDKHRL